MTPSVAGAVAAALDLPVPDSVAAFYAIPTSDGSVETASLVAAGLGQVEEKLPRPLPQPLMQVHRVGDLPPLPVDGLAAAGATDEQLARVSAATHLVLVSVGGRPGWPPAHEWIARALAAGAAARLGADVIDLLATAVLDLPAIQASLPDADGMVCLADWVSVGCWLEADGYTCTTTGLHRFGLPELQTLAVPPHLVDPWGRAMLGLAGRLLAAWQEALHRQAIEAPTVASGAVAAAPPSSPAPTTRPQHEPGSRSVVAVPAEFELSDTDVIEAHARTTEATGPRAGGTAGATVKLGLAWSAEPGQRSAMLTVRPPRDWSGTAAEHLAQACLVLGDAAPLTAVPAPVSAELQEAMATARAGLGAARARFAAGEFAAGQRLLVKYAIAADETIEYMWAAVTSWQDPYRILATAAEDSFHHPQVRAGRPVVVDAASVVDWAVDDERLGIVEGAWTRQHLQARAPS
jgi:hypothetical protein